MRSQFLSVSVVSLGLIAADIRMTTCCCIVLIGRYGGSTGLRRMCNWKYLICYNNCFRSVKTVVIFGFGNNELRSRTS